MRILTGLLLLLGCASILSVSPSYAQVKVYRAQLNPVAESGYYNVELDPRLVGSAKENFADLRIFQQHTQGEVELPYFIRSVQPTAKEAKIRDYPIVQRVEKDSINRVVLYNESKKKTTDFYVTINKADVSITASVRGSNDQKEWFSVKQKHPIYTHASSGQGEATLFVAVPEGQYLYYELELINNQATPLKLNRVSTVVDTQTYGQFSPTLLKFDETLIKNVKKTTLISFAHQEDYYKLNKLSVDIDMPQEYYRKALLRDTITHVSVPLTLSSKSANEFIMEDVAVQNPFIEIFNGSNPPLRIRTMKAYALTRFATVYLEANKTYEVIVDRALVEAPDYDIKHFKSELPLVLPTVKSFDFTSYEVEQAKEQKDSGINFSVILWGVLAVVGLIVVYICYQAFKKIGQ